MLAAFGIRGRVRGMTSVAGAWSNRVYRLDADTGTFAVKELRNPWDSPRWREWLAAAWEFEQLALAAGVPMPEPVPNPGDGGCLAWVGVAHGDVIVPVRLHVWVDGAAAESGPVTGEVAAWAGRTLARLHLLGIQPADRGVFPVISTATARRWPTFAEQAHLAGAPWAGQLLDLVPTVSLIAELAESSALRHAGEVMTHGDVDQKNLLITTDGPVLCDWDVAMPLVPRRELADVAMSMAGWEHPGIARSVTAAYSSAGGEPADFGPEDLGPSLMTGLDWIAFNIGRATGARPATSAESALSNRLLPGLLARLPREVDAALGVRQILQA